MTHPLQEAIEMLEAARKIMQKYEGQMVDKYAMDDALYFLTNDVLPEVRMFLRKDVEIQQDDQPSQGTIDACNKAWINAQQI